MENLPPLKALRVFEACIRLGSFSKAAKELNVGQPAISHQIHALESDLGVKLFERLGTKLVPTANAISFYRVVAGAFNEVAQATIAIKKSTRPPGLRLATYPGIAMFWLMPRLGVVKKQSENLMIQVTTAERDRDIPFDDIDCAILFGEGNWPGYESYRLIREEVVPVAAPAIAGSEGPYTPSRLLERGPLIHLEDQDERWFTWSDWRDRRSPDTLKIDEGITVTNHGIAIHQALIGQGIALGWMGVIDELIANKLLIPLDNNPITSDRGYFLVCREQFSQSPIGGLLLKALRK